jgi:hypothetical protein
MVKGTNGPYLGRMLDGHRTWMRRLGTVAGLAMLMFGLYLALLYSPTDCLPSTPEHQNACDVGTPSHPHFLLGLGGRGHWSCCLGRRSPLLR